MKGIAEVIPGLRHGDRIRLLSAEEKASLTTGKDFWQTRDIPRLGIPSIFLADGPHGIRRQAAAADHLGLNPSLSATCFPTAATLANSWDPGLAWRVGEALGREAASQSVQVLLGPGLNMKRSPLCGRNFEYFSEDPVLAGTLSAAIIQGIQSTGVAACAKHFAANNQETARMTNDSVVDMRTLREIYLTGFEMAVREGGVRTVMSAYNLLNGTYANEHRELLQDILRREWGFDGCVITDWGGCNDRVAGLLAGNELEMPGNATESVARIKAALESGELPPEDLDRALDRLLELVFRTSSETRDTAAALPVDMAAHHRLAREAAVRSAVLLQNRNGILPLAPGSTVGVIGDFARAPRYQGAGSSQVNPWKVTSPLEALKSVGLTVAGYEPGFDRRGRNKPGLAKKALELARRCDTVLLFLGLDEIAEAEGKDREHLDLPEVQNRLAQALAEVHSRVVVILSCGAAVTLPWAGKVAAILHGYLGGQAAGEAIADLVTGAAEPSGRLAETLPLHLADTPAADTFPGSGKATWYREGPYIGYRHYTSAGIPVAFPFGHGLSYTTFAWSAPVAGHDGVRLRVRNTGKRRGSETVQLYVGRRESRVFRPLRELKGFARVELAPGEEAAVFIPFDRYTFRTWDTRRGRFVEESGIWTLETGASATDIRGQAFLTRAGEEIIGAPGPLQLPSYWSGKGHLARGDEFRILLDREPPVRERVPRTPLDRNDPLSACKDAPGLFGRLVYRIMKGMRDFLMATGHQDKAQVIMMGVWYLPFRGLARFGALMDMATVDGLLTMVNGHFFRGLSQALGAFRLYRRNRAIQIKESKND